MRLYNLFLSKDKVLARRIQQMTGFVPARLAIFKLAFSHKSSQNHRDYAQTNNERLEYLGDAVLGTIVAEYLFKKYPNADEGFLTKMRSKIVKRKSLNAIGDAMGLDVLLNEYNRTRLSASMLGNAVEALVGAVYLEKGYRPTKRFVIQRMLKLYVDMHELETVDDNYKSQLLEYCQKNGKQISYKLVKKFKQDRRDRFKVAVLVGGQEIASADDFNKKAAEQYASKLALKKLGVEISETVTPTQKVESRPRRKVHAKGSASTPKTKKPSTTKPSAPTSMAAAGGLAAQAAPTRESQAVSNDAASNKKAAKIDAPYRPYPSPPPKQRRNNTVLGRSVWHAVSTAAAVLDERPALPSSKGHTPAAKQAVVLPTPPRRKRNEKVDFAYLQEGVDVSAVATALKISLPAVSSRSKATKPLRTTKKKSSAPLASSKPTSTSVKTRRNRRPVPLTRMVPMLEDAGAAIGIAGMLVTSQNKRNSALRQQKTEKNQWDDQPLQLATNKVEVERLDEWENTLLEISDPRK